MSTGIFNCKKSCQFQRKRKLSGLSQSTQSTDDENNSERLSLLGKEKKYVQKKEKKYKTQLCKNFSETGSCPYRKKCKFAHGILELNDSKKQQGKFYRTKKCFSFWNEGICPYGQRCQFLHLKVDDDTAQFLQSWKVLVDMKTNQSGFSGSKLLKLLKIE